MTWVTNKATVTAVMTGYTEITDVLNISQIPQNNQHKGYIFYPQNANNGSDLTSSGYLTSDIAVIDVSYNNKNTTYDANYDLFVTLQAAIEALNIFAGWIERSFKPSPDKEFLATGRLRFYLGVRTQ